MARASEVWERAKNPPRPPPRRIGRVVSMSGRVVKHYRLALQLCIRERCHAYVGVRYDFENGRVKKDKMECIFTISPTGEVVRSDETYTFGELEALAVAFDRKISQLRILYGDIQFCNTLRVLLKDIGPFSMEYLRKLHRERGVMRLEEKVKIVEEDIDFYCNGEFNLSVSGLW